MKKKDNSSQKITPLYDRVLVKEVPKEDKKTPSGIIIPDTVKDNRSNKRGEVVAVGKGKYEDGKLVPISVKVGDEVIYGWGDEVIIDGVEYTLVRESEILAIVK